MTYVSVCVRFNLPKLRLSATNPVSCNDNVDDALNIIEIEVALVDKNIHFFRSHHPCSTFGRVGSLLRIQLFVMVERKI